MAEDQKPCCCSKMIKPKDLPIYTPEFSQEAKVIIKEEPSVAIEAVRTVRMGLNDLFKQSKELRQQMDHVIETGSAHTQASIGMLKEEENLHLRAGFVATGGLLGLMRAAWKRRGFFGQVIYTTIGAAIFASMLYPEDSLQFGKDIGDEGQRLSKIAINFVQGVQPDDVKPAKKD